MITGLDLVKEQIKIARGEVLGYKQEDLKINGHAMELRVYAEDPLNNFLPDIGTLQTYKTPKGNGIRVDDGFEEGMEIPIYYDPMIAKLITFGANRTEAIDRMIRAIDEYDITGIQTTLGFGKFVMQHQAFASGNFDTHFVSKYFNADSLKTENEEEAMLAALTAVLLLQKEKVAVSANIDVETISNWKKNRKQYI
jgi:acetyl/propionyl-CoA carboxylase alpha subunit